MSHHKGAVLKRALYTPHYPPPPNLHIDIALGGLFVEAGKYAKSNPVGVMEMGGREL